MSRRRFLKLIGGGALVTACGPRACESARLQASVAAPAQNGVRAIAFDLFTIFDPTEVDRRVATLLGNEGSLATTWKTRLFEYCWIRAASGQYVGFEQLVRDSLDYAARVHRISMTNAVQAKLEAAFTELPPWPDSRAALRELKARGLRLAPLANFAPRMIETLFDHAEMRDLFETSISTHRSRTYKPDPRAYALAETTFGVPRRQIAFAAFGGWDAAGARWYGFPTFWVNRLDSAPEQLVTADATGSDLDQLAAWVLRANG